MAKFGFNLDATHGAVIFKIGTDADNNGGAVTGFTEGLVIGTSEWAWMEEEDGRKICAALDYFSEVSAAAVEKLASTAKFKEEM